MPPYPRAAYTPPLRPAGTCVPTIKTASARTFPRPGMFRTGGMLPPLRLPYGRHPRVAVPASCCAPWYGACILRPLPCREAATTGAISEGRTSVLNRRKGDYDAGKDSLPYHIRRRRRSTPQPLKGRLCSTTRQGLPCGDCEIGHRLWVPVLQPTQRLPCQGSWPRSGLRGSTLRRRCTFREVPAAGSRPRRVSFARGVLDGRNVANPSVCLRQTPTGCGWRIMLRALARRLHSATAALPRSGNDRSDKRRANLCIESPKRRL